MVNWTNEQICDMFDNNPNITLAEMSRITGYTIPELKRILRGER